MKNLIALRKSHPAFRMPSSDLIRQNLEFLDLPSAEKNGPKKIDRLVSYQLKNNANGDAYKNILVSYNGNRRDERIKLPKGKWSILLDGFDFDLTAATNVKGSVFDIPGTTCVILVEKK
jgi:pullulanase